jgi:hypothetical protein
VHWDGVNGSRIFKTRLQRRKCKETEIEGYDDIMNDNNCWRIENAR